MTIGITELPPEGMQLGGVALAGDAERGTRTTEGLSLLFTAAGITVQGPQPQIERLLIWSGLDSATCSEQVVLPDGQNAAVMELTSGGQSIRFLLPSANVSPGQAAYLDQALPAWLQRYKDQAPAANGPGTPVPDPGSGGLATSPEPDGGQAPSGSPAVDTPPPTGAEQPPPPPPAPAGREPAPPILVTRGNAVVGRPATGAGPGGATNGTNGASAPGGTPDAEPAPTQLPPPPPVSPGAGAGAPLPPPPAPGTAVGLDAPPTAGGPTPAPHAAGAAESAAAASKPRTRGRRRAKREAEQAAAAAAIGAAPVVPATPPVDPVPLQLPLPPPPPEAGTDEGRSAKPKRTRRRRKAEQAAAATAAGAAGVAMTDLLAASPPPPPGVTGLDAPPPGAPVMPPPPPTAAPPSTAGPAPAEGPWGTLASAGEQSDGADGSEATADGGTAAGASRSRTGLVVLLAVLLVVVLGGIGYVLVKRHSSTAPPATAAAPPVTSPTAADTALATGVNLRLGDLPTGWVAGTTGPAQPPAVPASVATVADTALASCLSVPEPTIAALFQWSAAQGQTALVTSPVFHDGTAPGIQMRSISRTLAAPSDAATLSRAFAAPTFTSCYAQYQSALYGGAIAGATATVQPVALAQPGGVQAYGYVTTISLPGGASQVLGQAFMFGGRVETMLQPTTNGPSIPTAAFQPAYQAVSGRVAQAATHP